MVKFVKQTTSRIMTKPEFQVMRKALIKQGFDVKKLDGGYELVHTDGLLLMRAMIGTKGYLVRYVKDLFEVSE